MKDWEEADMFLVQSGMCTHQCSAFVYCSSLDVCDFNLPWSWISVPLFQHYLTSPDKSRSVHVAGKLAVSLSSCCVYHSRGSLALPFSKWGWLLCTIWNETVLQSLNSVVLKVSCSWHAVWCWENQISTKIITKTVLSNGLSSISCVFCWVHWARNSGC